jgi:hypothetical protein
VPGENGLEPNGSPQIAKTLVRRCEPAHVAGRRNLPGAVTYDGHVGTLLCKSGGPSPYGEGASAVTDPRARVIVHKAKAHGRFISNARITCRIYPRAATGAFVARRPADRSCSLRALANCHQTFRLFNQALIAYPDATPTAPAR